MKTENETLEVVYTTKKQVSMKDIADLLCTAFEGGVGYWCRIEGYKEPATVFDWQVHSTRDGYVYKYVQYPLSENGAVRLADIEDEGDEEYLLDLTSIQQGLTSMANKYPRHWANFLEDRYDAETGDVFVQCCLFGEVIYG